jgi:hypothetical protein
VRVSRRLVETIRARVGAAESTSGAAAGSRQGGYLQRKATEPASKKLSNSAERNIGYQPTRNLKVVPGIRNRNTVKRSKATLDRKTKMEFLLKRAITYPACGGQLPSVHSNSTRTAGS